MRTQLHKLLAHYPILYEVHLLKSLQLNCIIFNKRAKQTQEVEKLTRALEGAYITDGLPLQLASKYSTQRAVKSMI